MSKTVIIKVKNHLGTFVSDPQDKDTTAQLMRNIGTPSFEHLKFGRKKWFRKVEIYYFPKDILNNSVITII